MANENSLVALAQGQAANSQQEFNASFPGFLQAEQHQSALASGSPALISQAIAPAAQQITQATDQAKSNIMRTGPAGGEKNLALEQADVTQGAQVGSAATGSYNQSFNSLAGLAGQGVGESSSSANTAVSGYNSANQALGTLGNQQIAQKGAQLGALTGLGSDAATLGGAAIGAGGWGALFS